MSFLNVILLGGAAAGTIPLALHMLRRNQRKPLRWSAMQLLTGTTLHSRRRLRFEQLLLLAVRIAIPVLLALCMARPVLSWLKAGSNRAPVSLVMLLDDSASMGATTGGHTAFDEAKTALKRLLQGLPRGSEVALIPLTDPEAPIAELTVNIEGATSQLGQRRIQPAQAALAMGLETAAAQFASTHHARRKLVLLSDFQKSNWSQSEAAARNAAIERLRAMPHPPQIVFYDTGPRDSENVAVESLEFSKLPIGVGQPVQFRGALRNYGSAPCSDRTVRWKIDGEIISQTSTSIAAHESVQLLFEHTFSNLGPHSIELETEPDGISSDDAFFGSLQVREAIPILLVNGTSSKEALQGETDFLELALKPRSSQDGDSASLIQPTVIEPGALSERALSKVGTVVLANVHELTKQQVRELETFVQKGGGLIVFPGANVDADWYNKTLYRAGEGPLPATMAGLQTAGPISPADTPSSHPALEVFSTKKNPLNDLQIRSWFSLRTTEHATTLLSLDNGEPLFVERRFGRGLVTQAAIPCSPSWSNLPTRPSFVPLMQQLVLYSSATAAPPVNLRTGDLITTQLSDAQRAQRITIKRPDGKVLEVALQKAERAASAEFADTRIPGMYEIKIGSALLGRIAVNLTREESNPERLSEDAIGAIVAQSGGVLARSARELDSEDQPAGAGREVWVPLLWATVLLMFVELWVQQRFSRREGAGA